MRWNRAVSALPRRQRNRLPSVAQKDAQRVGRQDFACLKSQATKSRPGPPAFHQGWKCCRQWARRSGLPMAGMFCLCFFSVAHAQQSPTRPAAALPSATSQPPSPGPQSNTAVSGIPVAAQPRPTELRFVVLLDPAHGGADTGAMLDPATPEKTYTLALANQLWRARCCRARHRNRA